MAIADFAYEAAAQAQASGSMEPHGEALDAMDTAKGGETWVNGIRYLNGRPVALTPPAAVIAPALHRLDDAEAAFRAAVATELGPVGVALLEAFLHSKDAPSFPDLCEWLERARQAAPPPPQAEVPSPALTPAERMARVRAARGKK